MAEVCQAVQQLKSAGCDQPTLLHCSSAYPTPAHQANLAAIETLRRQTGCAVGWSDHTRQPGVLYRAIYHWGASDIEFHLDLDGQGAEFQTGHCWLPHEIETLIGTVKRGLTADGDGKKEPNPEEQPDRLWRADPQDGLRPFKQIRANWRPD